MKERSEMNSFEYALLNMKTPQLMMYAATVMDNLYNEQVKKPLNDAYHLWHRGSEYFLSEGYGRSKETGVVILDPLPFNAVLRNIPLVSTIFSYIPSVYIFSGTAQNLMAIADYGEANKDSKARTPHDRVQQATGATTIVNQLGAGARAEKRKIVNSLAIHYAFDYARELGINFDKYWDDNLSLQDNITYIGAKIIGNCFLGISDFPKKYISLIREANDLIADGDATKADFADMSTKILRMSDEILDVNADELYGNKRAYVLKQFESTDEDSFEQWKEKLINSHGGAGFLVESNLSFLLMVALAHISSSPEIMEELRNEIKDVHLENTGDLRSLIYLDCIYRETLRFASPTAVVPRYASQNSTMTVENLNNEKSTCTIRANSHLFFATRAIHHDDTLFPESKLFNPLRFKKAAENNEFRFIGKNYFPFSGGKRGCPAGSGFIEYAFKGFLVEFFTRYQLVLDKPLEFIPATAIHPRWKNEYSATLQKEDYSLELDGAAPVKI